jgi:hypothetical protein
MISGGSSGSFSFPTTLKLLLHRYVIEAVQTIGYLLGVPVALLFYYFFSFGYV